ncbi:hypothetical protein Pmani_016746 [Petrolisthes manimaculis]|uniref:Uncharacterized protein n=1 Tax=Petrolisthes manimaculis TaxID=1843537 RepID=A0AAE1PNA3_9EUCA|nr:hypothetical protein Pmani_016746 [Petrolisthes manimaculis]
MKTDAKEKWLRKPFLPHQVKPSDFPTVMDNDSDFMTPQYINAWPQLSIQALRCAVAMVGRDGLLIFYMRESNGITWDLEAELIRIAKVHKL